jgi:hypothetical protein
MLYLINHPPTLPSDRRIKERQASIRRLPKAYGLNFAQVIQTMLTFQSLLLLVICAGLGAVVSWLYGKIKGLSFQPQVKATRERLPSVDQTILSLVVAPTKPNRSPASPFAHQSDCIEALVSSPLPDDSYMITTECIIFSGTREECADFLDDRGIIPFEDTIEPFDARLQNKMNELGVRVFRRNLYSGPERH